MLYFQASLMPIPRTERPQSCIRDQRTRKLSAPPFLSTYSRYAKVYLALAVLCASLAAPTSATSAATIRNDCHCCAGSTEGGLLTTLTSTVVSDLRATGFVSTSQAAPLQTSSHLADDLVPTAGPLPLPRVKSWSIPKTCPWQIFWPLPDTPMPVIDNVNSPQFSLFPRPKVSPYKMTVYNFCSYDLWLEPHVGARVENVEHVAANGVYSRPFQAADEQGGVSLKVSKIKGNFARPVQIEYSRKVSTIAYDLSLIDCLGQTGETRYGKVVRNGNTSACAGHEAGLQLGNRQSRSFQCGSGAWCDDQAYFYEASQ